MSEGLSLNPLWGHDPGYMVCQLSGESKQATAKHAKRKNTVIINTLTRTPVSVGKGIKVGKGFILAGTPPASLATVCRPILTLKQVAL